MKWKRRAHEFDGEFEIYKKQRLLSKEVYIFGAGEIGKTFSSIVNRFGRLNGFIDNDGRKQGTMYCGFSVISLQKYLDKKAYENSIILLCLKESYSKEVKKQLEEYGLVENEVFFTKDEYEKRLRIVLFFERNILYLPLAQISLTERCTLRCKKCAHACNLVSPQKADLTLKEAMESADFFFKYVDYIDEFVLIGGEPLLYLQLPKIADYIGENYRKRIGIFSITTNGTILPNEELLSVCNIHNMLFRVSNYEESIPRMKERLDAFRAKVESQGVACVIGKPGMDWTDYGFDYVDRKATPEELEKVFDACRTSCHEVRKNRFYFCVMARSVAENMNRDIGADDFFDFSMVDEGTGKKEFFEYTMGYSEKGYLDMCNYCHGIDRMKYPILAGEQMRY